MSMTLREDKSIWIEEYSLKDFVLSIQKTVQAGYEVSLENHNFPQGFSGHFTVGMVDAKAVVEVKQEPTKQAENTTEEVVKQTTPTTKRTTTRK